MNLTSRVVDIVILFVIIAMAFQWFEPGARAPLEAGSRPCRPKRETTT